MKNIDLTVLGTYIVCGFVSGVWVWFWYSLIESIWQGLASVV